MSCKVLIDYNQINISPPPPLLKMCSSGLVVLTFFAATAYMRRIGVSIPRPRPPYTMSTPNLLYSSVVVILLAFPGLFSPFGGLSVVSVLLWEHRSCQANPGHETLLVSVGAALCLWLMVLEAGNPGQSDMLTTLATGSLFWCCCNNRCSMGPINFGGASDA